MSDGHSILEKIDRNKADKAHLPGLQIQRVLKLLF